MVTARSCEIGRIECRQHNGISRVSARVDGRPVWFESADVALRPSAEAFASAFLVPALHHRLALRIAAPLSPLWLRNVGKLCGVFHQWWEYPDAPAIQCEGELECPAKKPHSGQCFTGGADSFYSLLRGSHQTDYLVFVHGYDISYRDQPRMRSFRPSLAAVSEAVGRPALVLRTNLRKHPSFASTPWERTHGAALAVVAHLLSDRIGALVVPSTQRYDDPDPCGSHWSTDPLWSSESMEIIHDDTRLIRLDKLKSLECEPLVRRHLRVCWENRTVWGNCSRCEKCARTMIVLAARGQRQHFPTFDRRTPIPAILDAMGPLPERMHCHYHALLREGLPAEIESAVLRMLQRARPARGASLRLAARKVKLALGRIGL
jgi:hypothetical protein